MDYLGTFARVKRDLSGAKLISIQVLPIDDLHSAASSRRSQGGLHRAGARAAVDAGRKPKPAVTGLGNGSKASIVKR